MSNLHAAFLTGSDLGFRSHVADVKVAGIKYSHRNFPLHYLILLFTVCICLEAFLLTASKFKGTSMGVHGEILQLHRALCWYSQSERIQSQKINWLCDRHHRHHHCHLRKLTQSLMINNMFHFGAAKLCIKPLTIEKSWFVFISDS